MEQLLITDTLFMYVVFWDTVFEQIRRQIPAK